MCQSCCEATRNEVQARMKGAATDADIAEGLRGQFDGLSVNLWQFGPSAADADGFKNADFNLRGLFS